MLYTKYKTLWDVVSDKKFMQIAFWKHFFPMTYLYKQSEPFTTEKIPVTFGQNPMSENVNWRRTTMDIDHNSSFWAFYAYVKYIACRKK